MKNGKELMVSCSDDDTIRLYQVGEKLIEGEKEVELALVRVYDTHFITDWHTLTYLALEEVNHILTLNQSLLIEWRTSSCGE